MRRFPLIFAILVMAAIACGVVISRWFALSGSSDRDLETPPITFGEVPSQPASSTASPETSDEFRAWLRRKSATTDERDMTSWEAEGRPLAEKRTRNLARLMRLDTQAALEASLRWDEWAMLPARIRALSEEPFSELVRQDSYVGCDPGKGISTKELRITRPDGSDLRAYTFGRREWSLSRKTVPVQGFVLGNEAALWPDAVQVLNAREAGAIREMAQEKHPATTLSAWSGHPLGKEDAVELMIGGRLKRVLPDELAPLKERLHAWETIPGGASWTGPFVAWLGPEDSGGWVPLMEVAPAPPEDNPWTTTPKRLLLMRVDFSDLAGARESDEVLIDKLSNEVSDSLEEMSFGKTRLIVTVTPEVIRMPQLSGYYAAENAAGRNGNGQLHAHARVGAAALGYVLADYDFWCVQFNNIGMGYGGLAILGGKESWIQSSGTSVFVHEFGHNYGVGHANRWVPDPVNGPFGPNGTQIDYGSTTSIMGSGPFPAGHFDAQAKAFLGWLDSSQWQDVTTSGRYRLWRADHVQSPRPAGIGGLRIARPSPTGDSIWLSYKRAIPERRRLERGVSVIWEQATARLNNRLVKAGRNGSFPEDDYELPVGQTFSADGFHVTPVGRGGSPPWQWIDIDIRIDAAPANANPIASWSSGPDDEIQPLQTFRLDVSASDPDGDALAYHWDTGDGSEVSYNGPTLIHTYRTAGLYQLSVEVSDHRGGKTVLSRTFDVALGSSDWAPRMSGTTSQLNHIASSPQRAVAVSGSGLVVNSVDGENWTLHDLRSARGLNALDLREVGWDGNGFITIGRERAVSGGAWQGCIYRSTDGLSWTRMHLGGTIFWRLAQGGGRWVAAGENATMRTSVDGITWTTVTFPASDHINGIAYGNGVWLAIPDSNSGRTWAFTSTDLVTWTYRDWSEGFTNNQIVRPARYFSGRFYLGGFVVGLRAVSGDGLTLAPTPLLSGLNMNDMIEVNGVLYLAGDLTEDSVQKGHVHVSTSGDSWQRMPLSGAAMIRGVTFFGGRLITVGNAGEIWQSGPVYSPVGSGWHAWQTANRSVLGAEDDPFETLPGNAMPNFYLHALGIDADDPVPSPMLAPDATGRHTLTVPRNGISPDILYRISRSLDLKDWTTDGVEILVDDANQLKARGSDPEADREFLRFDALLRP